MSQRLRAGGITPGKVWNYQPSTGPLSVPTPNDPSGHVEWNYHVAPTVPVQQPDGSVQDMVIDPSISDRPLTPQQWRGLQSQPGSTLVQTDDSPYYRAPDGRTISPPSDGDVQNTFAEHRANRAANWAGSP
jgi:hypothetical protein